MPKSHFVVINTLPTGRVTASQRLDALIVPESNQNCGKATNGESVCSQEIPLNDFMASGRAMTVHVVKRFFDG
jgi:succinate dehydrogenase / fumarate reductase, iron-sulfur subunit